MSEPFKVLGIASGRPMGNAEVALRECLLECEKLGKVDVRIVRLRSLNLQQCDGCFECLKDAANGGQGLCPIKDDFEWLKEQILWADGIVFSDPSFCYIPTSEVIIAMNRAMGAGKDYVEACRKAKKVVSLICVGGSDTIDFNLPMQYAAMHALCPGFELADQMYCNWIRGKGYIADQPYHMERCRLSAKRFMNKLNGYNVPELKTKIMKLNPMEYPDDKFLTLEPCPVCHQSVNQMENMPFFDGQFRCAICGATGHIEYRGGDMTYVWDDDTVAHNRLHKEHDAAYVGMFAKAHAPAEGPKAEVKDFPRLTVDNDIPQTKPRIIAVYAGPVGGTSELLARKALEAATADGQFEGILVDLLHYNIHWCTGCLLCKVNARYRGGIDKCVLKDDMLWLAERLMEANGIIWSFDSVNGFTYGKVVSFLQRFGLGYLQRGEKQFLPTAMADIISSFDDEVKNATYCVNHLNTFYSNHGPFVAEQLNRFVPLQGDGILANPRALGEAAGIGMQVKNAAAAILVNPGAAFSYPTKNGMCPNCGLDLLEFEEQGFKVSCARCDAHGRFEHRFGQNVVIWDDFSVRTARGTMYGGMLHFKHIDYSQSEDRDVLDNPKVHEELLRKYVEYGKLVSPKK